MKILQKILGGGGNILYYPGCLTKFVAPELKSKYEEILKRLGIDFIQLHDNEFCCGSPVKNSGAEENFKELAEKNQEIFKEHSIVKIISNCPSCVAVFKLDYAEILGQNWDIEVQHVSEVIAQNLEKVKNIGKGKKATYHDPCHLGKTLGIYDEPRAIIKAAGFELVEMGLSRENSFCCGAGGGVRSNHPELSLQIGKDRVDQTQQTKVEVLITSCPMCHHHLKESSGDLEVLELCELV